MHQFKLPIPPSNNKYYRHVNNRVLLSAEGRAYKQHVELLCKKIKITGSVRVEIDIHSKNNVRRDLDNFPKGIFDALTYAQVWADDSLVDEMEVIRHENNKNDPHIIVRIFEL